MSVLLDAEASFSKFLNNRIRGLVWFNSFNSWHPEGRAWSSLQFCAWHFLVVKCLSGNKSHKNPVSPEAAAECQDRIFFYWVTYQPLGMHLCLLGWGRNGRKYMYRKIRKNKTKHRSDSWPIPWRNRWDEATCCKQMLNSRNTFLNQTGHILCIVVSQAEW